MSQVPPLVIGQRFENRNQLRALPVGSVVRGVNTGNIYTRTAGDHFVISEVRTRRQNMQVGQHRAIHGLNPSLFTLVSIGDGAMVTATLPDRVDEETTVEMESFTHYMYRFWTGIWGSATRSSIRVPTVEEAMETLGVEPVITPGMPIHVWHSRLWYDLPQYTTVVFGDPTETRRDRFAVWAKERDTSNRRYDPFDYQFGWVRILGGMSAGSTDFGVVEAIPDVAPAEWVTRPVTVRDALLIQKFKAHAYNIGAGLCDDNGWCGEYALSMQRVDITSADGTEQTPAVTPAEASRLPEGTILRHVGMRGGVRWYVRTDASTNPCATVGVIGTLTGHWAQHMVPVWQPGQQMVIPVASHREMVVMPPGTQMLHNYDAARRASRSAAETWTKTNQVSGQWQHDMYQHNYPHTSFNARDMVYINVPLGGSND